MRDDYDSTVSFKIGEHGCCFESKRMTSQGQREKKRQKPGWSLGDTLTGAWRGVKRSVLRPFAPKWEKEYHRMQEEEKRQDRRLKKRAGKD